MLPRLRPAEFYDLVIQVAIVRPGPIQGDMVHPYLRRRQGRETVHFPSPAPEHGPPDELRRVLGKTLGVPLFQEQAMRIAIEAARFTPEEANQLRRAMATFRHVGTIHAFFAKMVEGMVARGYERDFAERCFRQIEGFGTYGFPESHAASFALLVYVSAWIKCHHPATFACALLNAQPMGFYAPAQIVRCARDHGVDVRGVDAVASLWDCTIEPGAVLRLGLRMINGFRQDWADRLVSARAAAPVRSLDDLARAGVPHTALVALADADALRGLGLDRRAALWAVRGLRDEAALPLFAPAVAPAPDMAALLPRVADDAAIVSASLLPPMTSGEHVIADYQTTGLSLKAHPMRFLRAAFAREAVVSCAEANAMGDGAAVRVAGVVLLRQRPGNGSVIFCTLEDETGCVNVVIWESLIERFRRAVVGSSVMLVQGRVQRAEHTIVHIIAERLEDRSALMGAIDIADLGTLTIPADELPTPASPAPRPQSPRHPRHVRVIPRSRDFR
jgi:error-prone DNA polymerase